MKGVLPWLVRWARRTSTKDFFFQPWLLQSVEKAGIIFKSRTVTYIYHKNNFTLYNFSDASTTNCVDVEGVSHSMDVEGVSHSMDVEGVSHSMDVEGVSHSMDVEGVSHSMDAQGVFPPTAVWTCRVFSTIHSMDVQGVFPPPTWLTLAILSR